MSTTMTEVPASRQAGCVENVPDPQAPERARRWTYTGKYKRDVLAEFEACDRAGRGALLRREGLYTSLISAWRDQRDKGALEALDRASGSPVRLGARTGRRAGTDRRVRRRRHPPSRPASDCARVPRQSPRNHLRVAGARPVESAGSPASTPLIL